MEFDVESISSSDSDDDESIFHSKCTNNPNARLVEERCLIDILNEDCLLHVFTFLPVIERVKLEKVCMKWAKVTAVMWRRVQRISVDDYLTYYDKVTIDDLRQVLKRCGEHVKELYISMYGHYFSSKVHSMIGRYCPNLQILDLSALPPNSDNVITLAKYCRHLKNINFDNAVNVDDSVFDLFFQQNPNLETVSLFGSSNISGKCLLALPVTMQSLCLDYCDELRVEHLRNALQRMTSLNDLSINSCTTTVTTIMEVITRHSPNLITLSLNEYGYSNDNSINLLKNITSLKKLSLSRNLNVNDNFMCHIGRDLPNLECLDISGCDSRTGSREDLSSLSSQGLVEISALPNLRDLTLNFMDIVDNDAILSIASRGLLRKLSICGCSRVEDSAVRYTLDLCRELTFLDLSRCDLITNGVVLHADKMLAQQSNRRNYLIIKLQYTSVDLKGLSTRESSPHPLLKVIDVNSINSVNHHFSDL